MNTYTLLPNKIYVGEHKTETAFDDGESYSHFVVTVAASDIDTAKKYLRDKIGIEVEPVWLMGAVYPTIYNQTGSKPLDVQAKILYNGSFHVYENNGKMKSL